MTHDITTLRLAFEAGYKSCEAGDSLEAALAKFDETFADSNGRPAPFDSAPFTEEDRKKILEILEEDVRDGIQEVALSDARRMSFFEAVFYLDNNPEATVALIQGQVLPEDERGNEEYFGDFCIRLGLMTEGFEATDWGLKYVAMVNNQEIL